jgi:hypothetical protein
MTPAKWSAYQIPSVIVAFVVLVCKVQFVSLIPKATRGLEPISYREALLSTLLHAISYRRALLSTLLHAISHRGAILSTLLRAISHRGALMSTLLHAISYRGALLSTLLHAISYRGALLNTPLHAISYREALLSTLLQATVYMFLHNSMNVLVQTANKMGLQTGTCDVVTTVMFRWSVLGKQILRTCGWWNSSLRSTTTKLRCAVC